MNKQKIAIPLGIGPSAVLRVGQLSWLVKLCLQGAGAASGLGRAPSATRRDDGGSAQRGRESPGPVRSRRWSSPDHSAHHRRVPARVVRGRPWRPTAGGPRDWRHGGLVKGDVFPTETSTKTFDRPPPRHHSDDSHPEGLSIWNTDKFLPCSRL